MFMAALFIIVKIWKQHIYIHNMHIHTHTHTHTHTVEYYSATKMNEFLPFTTTSKNLDGIF